MCNSLLQDGFQEFSRIPNKYYTFIGIMETILISIKNLVQNLQDSENKPNPTPFWIYLLD